MENVRCGFRVVKDEVRGRGNGYLAETFYAISVRGIEKRVGSVIDSALDLRGRSQRAQIEASKFDRFEAQSNRDLDDP